MRMKAMKFTEALRAEIVDIQRPIPKTKEVLIKVKAAGICASDISAYKGTHTYRVPPVITGHELSGEVVELGADVAALKVGDRVAVEPHIGCGRCFFCRKGYYHECPQKRLIGAGDWIGGFSEYVVAAEAMCYALPEEMTFEEGAAIEPLCVGLHAVRRANIGIGERVAILGCGTIGMMTLLCSKLNSPQKILISDINAAKRNAALGHGADVAIDPVVENPLEKIRDETDGLGVDAVFVAVGLDEVMKQALQVCRCMGRVILIASHPGETAFNTRPIQSHELSLIGTSMYTSDDYLSAMALCKKGAFDLKSLITRRISLEEAPSVVSALASGNQTDDIKITICFD
jgi:L-iditol 2-dehydrogenase